MTMEELAVILGVKDKWYEEKREEEVWFLGFRNLVVGGTNGWSDRECVWFHNEKKLHFLEPYLIDGLWDIWAEEGNHDQDEFDEWLRSPEGHAEIEDSLYCLLDAAEHDGNNHVYVEE